MTLRGPQLGLGRAKATATPRRESLTAMGPASAAKRV